MLRSSKFLPLSFALAILALANLTMFVGCSSSNAQARFVNAIPDSVSTLDFDIDGTKEFSLAFPQASGSTYIGIPAGTDAIEGFAAGSTTVAFPSQNVSIGAGSDTTLVATGFLSGSVTILNPVDNNTAPADGNVNFRVIDASPSGPGSVDVWILPNGNNESPTNTAPTISSLSSPSAPTTATSGYITIPYNSNGLGYNLYVAPHGSTTALFNGNPITAGSLSLGTVRTIVLVDGNNTISSTPIVLSDVN